jgi:heme-degrading monooxygenase HmoA
MAETYTSGMWLVNEGEEEAFVAAWTEFVTWARSMPGSGTFRLVRDVDEPTRFMSFAPRESFEPQQSWKGTDEFREGMMRVRRHTRDFTPSVYELVTVVE